MALVLANNPAGRRRSFNDLLSQAMDRFSVHYADTGGMIPRIRREFVRGSISREEIGRIVGALGMCKLVGLPPAEVKWKRLVALANTDGHNGQQITRRMYRRATRMLDKIQLQVVNSTISRDITARADRDGEDPVDPDDPPLTIVGNDIQRYNNVTICEAWIGPDINNPLRQKPNGMIGQAVLPFPDGDRLYPVFFVEMGLFERYNQEDPAVVFDRQGMKAQVPRNMPRLYVQVTMSWLDRMNTRVKPSAQYPFVFIANASKTSSEKVPIALLIAALTFCHWKVEEKGRNSFLYRQLKAMKLLKILDYRFDWLGCIRDGKVWSQPEGGRELRITLADPPARRHRGRQTRYETTKEGKRLAASKVYTFQGTNSAGRYIYQKGHDTYIGVQAQIDQLRALSFDVLTDRDEAQGRAEEAFNSGARAVVPGRNTDAEGNPAFG